MRPRIGCGHIPTSSGHPRYKFPHSRSVEVSENSVSLGFTSEMKYLQNVRLSDGFSKKFAKTGTACLFNISVWLQELRSWVFRSAAPAACILSAEKKYQANQGLGWKNKTTHFVLSNLILIFDQCSIGKRYKNPTHLIKNNNIKNVEQNFGYFQTA